MVVPPQRTWRHKRAKLKMQLPPVHKAEDVNAFIPHPYGGSEQVLVN